MSRYRVRGKRRRKKTALARLNSLPETPRRDHRRTVLWLLLSGTLFGGLYLAGWRLQSTRFYRVSIAIEIVCYLLLALLVIAYVIVNRGLSRDLPTAQQLSDSMTEEQKAEFIADLTRAHDRARPLVYLIFPLLIVVCFDIFYTLVIAK